MIWFNNEKALAQLINNGEVFTLRTKRKKEGRHLLRTNIVELPQDSYVIVGFKTKAKPSEWKTIEEKQKGWKKFLLPYVSKSGFESIDKWINALMKLHKTPKFDKLFLYSVYLPSWQHPKYDPYRKTLGKTELGVLQVP